MRGKIDFICSDVPIPDAIIISLDHQREALLTFSQCAIRLCKPCRHLVELLAQLLDLIVRLDCSHMTEIASSHSFCCGNQLVNGFGDPSDTNHHDESRRDEPWHQKY